MTFAVINQLLQWGKQGIHIHLENFEFSYILKCIHLQAFITNHIFKCNIFMIDLGWGQYILKKVLISNHL